MKNRHLYTVTAAAFVLLSATNCTTLYLYIKEKISHHRSQTAAKNLQEQFNHESQTALEGYRKEAQQSFVDLAQVFHLAKDEQNGIRQKLVSALSQRGQQLQSFYANRASGIQGALNIIQQDNQIFGLYNQYLQIADRREQTLMDRSKPLGAALGLSRSSDQR